MQDNRFKDLIRQNLNAEDPDEIYLIKITELAEQKIKSKRFNYIMQESLSSEQPDKSVETFILAKAESHLNKQSHLKWARWFVAASVIMVMFYFIVKPSHSNDSELEDVLNYDATMMTEIYQLSQDAEQLENLNKLSRLLNEMED